MKNKKLKLGLANIKIFGIDIRKSVEFIAISMMFFLVFSFVGKAEYSEYIVKFKNIDKISKSSEVVLSKDVSMRKAFPFFDSKAYQNQVLNSNSEVRELNKYSVVRIPVGKESEVIEILKNSGEIEEISPNHTFKLHQFEQPNDPRYSEQWALEQVKAERAWQFASGEGIIVGVIDTGIDYNHPDLMNNLWVNSKEDINGNGRFDNWLSTEIRNGTSGDLNGIDDDGNGFVDDVIGFDMVNQKIANFGDWTEPDGNPYDENDHGTVVAGVIAAEKNNGQSIVGLAYNAKIMSVRAFDVSGNADADNIAAAIVYAVLNGANVLNFSFGEVNASPIVHSAIKFAYSRGVIMIASTGNENKDIKHYPSDYPEVIAVGASTKSGKRWDFSNYGGNLALIAPGYLVLSTIPGGLSSLKSGTSLAAPYVAATVALLLEKNPQLDFHSIKSILQATAESVNPDGWDNLTGAGILNAASALENAVPGKMTIDYPIMHSSFNKSKTSSIAVVGSSLTPLFDSYSVLIGLGTKPSSWDTISVRKSKALLDDTLGIIDLTKLIDTNYTISLKVYLKNRKTLEARTQIKVYSAQNPFEITELRTYKALEDDRAAIVVSAISSQDAQFQVHYREKGTDDKYTVISDELELSSNHQVILSTNLEYDKDYEARAFAIIHSKDTAVFNFEFNLPKVYFPKYNFSRKQYSFPRSYIYPEVTDFTGNGKPNIFYNDTRNLFFGQTFLAEFEDGKFNIIDTLREGWLVTGIGNSNGDEFKDILTYGGGRTQVYQRTQEKQSTFADKIFSTDNYTFWAEHYYDLDGDGKEEIIAYNDSCFYAYTFRNGKYELLAQAILPIEYRSSGVWRGSAVGDFDGSGYPNLYHSNNNGHSFIFEFIGGRFNLIYANIEGNAAENQYVSALDIDGDGILEIVHGSYYIMPRRNDFSRQLWRFKVIKSDGIGSFESIDSIFISGVRAGPVQKLNTSYRNGVTGGNVDGNIGDELIISTMPNLYIFKWNNEDKKFDPLWNYPAAFTNSAWVYDFDGNGKAEIGFSTFSQTEFWEFEGNYDKLEEPHLDGWALSNTSARLEWNLIDDADQYEILELIDNQSTFVSYGKTTESFALLNNLSPNKYYRFFVVALSKNTPSRNSELSNEKQVFVGNIGEALAVEVESEELLKVEFSVLLPEFTISPDRFIIENIESGLEFSPKEVLCIKQSAILSLPQKLESGEYTIKIESFRDFYGNPINSSILKFNIDDISAGKEIYLTSLNAYSATFMKLTYSEAVDSTAINPSNYEISPFGKILQAGIIPGEPESVELALSSEFKIEGKGKNYFLTARNITGPSGNVITSGAGNTLGFTIAESSLANVFVYPNPIRLSSKEDIYIAGLTRRAKIEILSLDGELLRTLQENDGNGGVYWDGYDNLGNALKPGVYLVKAKNIDMLDSDFEIIKFMVVP